MSLASALLYLNFEDREAVVLRAGVGVFSRGSSENHWLRVACLRRQSAVWLRAACRTPPSGRACELS